MDYAKLSSLGIEIDRGRLGQDQGFEVLTHGMSHEPETFFKELGTERPAAPLEDLTRLNPKQSPISAYHVKKMWRTMAPAKKRAIIAKRKRVMVKALVLFFITATCAFGGTITATRTVKAHDEEYRALYQFDPTNRWWHFGDSNVHYKAQIDVEHIQYYGYDNWGGRRENRQHAGSTLGTYVPEGCFEHDDPTVYVAAVMGWRVTGPSNETLKPVPPPEPKPPEKAVSYPEPEYTDAMRITALQDDRSALLAKVRKLKLWLTAGWVGFICMTALTAWEILTCPGRRRKRAARDLSMGS